MKQNPVSPNNPCPYLRSLVAAGQLADDQVPLTELAETVVGVARGGEGSPELPVGKTSLIAVIANGLNPLSIFRSWRSGVRLNALRNGPLDKKGVGSGIIDANGVISDAELARLAEFAVDKSNAAGGSEPGLGSNELQKFMDANFARAEGRRRRMDRALMDGEWPVLLTVMGKEGADGRYLSLSDVQQLFVEQQLPNRMQADVQTTSQGNSD